MSFTKRSPRGSFEAPDGVGILEPEAPLPSVKFPDDDSVIAALEHTARVSHGMEPDKQLMRDVADYLRAKAGHSTEGSEAK